MDIMHVETGGIINRCIHLGQFLSECRAVVLRCADRRNPYDRALS